MVRYHLGWEATDGTPSDQTGKGLRPALCLLACEATGAPYSRALPAAAAVELVHNFSLVHDDIQDHDRIRRHRPTVWAVWGEAQAINAGDAMLVLGRSALLRLAGEGVSAETVVDASRILDERTLEMVEGQTMDIAFEGSAAVSLPDYLDMVDRKTGALFDCALYLGALAGAQDIALAGELGRFGRAMGVLFQVRDDMNGVWGVETEMGKQPAADIRRRKKSAPIVHALDSARGETRERLLRTYAKSELDDADISLVLDCLDETGAKGYCERLVAQKSREALAVLDSVSLGDGARELRQLAAGGLALSAKGHQAAP